MAFKFPVHDEEDDLMADSPARLQEEDAPDFSAPDESPPEYDTPSFDSLLSPAPLVSAPARTAMGDAAQAKVAMRKAQNADSDEQAKANIRASLYSAFSRRPMQQQSTGTPEMDSLIKRMAMERQGRMDETAQDDKAFARELALKKLLQPKSARPGDPEMDALKKELTKEQILGLRSGRGLKEESNKEADTQLAKARKEWGDKLHVDFTDSSWPDIIEHIRAATGDEKAQASIAAKGAKESAKKSGDEAKRNASAVGYRGGVFEVPEGGALDSAARNNFVNKVSAAGSVQKALDKILVDLDEITRNPSGKLASAAKSRIQSLQGLVAPQINVALGQGAMAAEEYNRVKQSIGDISSSDFWVDAIHKAIGNPQDAGLLAERLRAAQGFFDESVKSQAEALRLNYRKGGGGAERTSMPGHMELGGAEGGPKPTGRRKKDKSGAVWEELSDGTARKVE